MSKHGNLVHYVFRNEKEAHFFHTFVLSSKKSPVRSSSNHPYGVNSWRTIEVEFEPSQPVQVREYKATLKVLEMAIENAFPHFLTK